MLPPHGHYVEPFAGSLAVLLAKRASRMETVNDLDRAVVTFWRVLRERPADLARACALTPHSLAEFDDAEDVDAPVGDEVEQARRVWVRLSQGRAGMLCSTGWRHFVDPSNSSFGMPDYLAAYVSRIASAAERLRRVSLECRPALDVIAWYGRSPDVLLYLDPPYLRSTRSSGAYRHEMTEQDHRDLAAALRECRAAVALSGYPSDLYDLELYADWYRTAFTSGTGQNAETRGNRTEVLWSNRPFPQGSLFDGLEGGGRVTRLRPRGPSPVPIASFSRSPSPSAPTGRREETWSAMHAARTAGLPWDRLALRLITIALREEDPPTRPRELWDHARGIAKAAGATPAQRSAHAEQIAALIAGDYDAAYMATHDGAVPVRRTGPQPRLREQDDDAPPGAA